MNAAAHEEIEGFMSGLERRNPGEPEFQQAVREVAETLIPFTLDHDPGASGTEMVALPSASGNDRGLDHHRSYGRERARLRLGPRCPTRHRDPR